MQQLIVLRKVIRMFFLDYCSGFESYKFILRIVAYLLKIIQWIIPIALILLITFDVFKAIIGGDEKKSKEALGKIGKRLLYAVLLFFVPLLVKLLFSEIGKLGSKNQDEFSTNIQEQSNFFECFNQILKEV